MNETVVPIETILGKLNGRDCIYLDSVKQDDRGNLIFNGEINGGRLKDKQNKKWIAYELSFSQVIAYFSCELDTYFNLETMLQKSDNGEGSSFDIMENSKWLESFPIRSDYRKNHYKHYRLMTYDRVYNIIATSYQLHMND